MVSMVVKGATRRGRKRGRYRAAWSIDRSGKQSALRHPDFPRLSSIDRFRLLGMEDVRPGGQDQTPPPVVGSRR